MKRKHIFRANVGSEKINRSLAGNSVVFLFLLVIAVFMSAPFVFSIVQAFKPIEELFVFPPKFFVRNPTLENFRQIFVATDSLWVPFERYLFNSVFTTLAGTAAYVVIASLAALPLAKMKFPFDSALNKLIELALLFTGPVIAVAQFVIIAKGQMLNTYWAMILPALASPFGVFLMRQFMCDEKMIPSAMLESARIDGAGWFRIYWSIVMPLVKPAWLTLIIFTFQSLWGGSGSRFIFTEAMKPLPTVLSQISSSGIARAGVGSAVAVLMMIPPIVTFIISQSNVMETMSHAGIKG
ncbi:MAG: carbohydrate ABC transporter permease [Aristaeellaceae bacterium]